MAEPPDSPRPPPCPCPVMDLRRKPPASRPLPVPASQHSQPNLSIDDSFEELIATISRLVPNLSDSSVSLEFSIDESAPRNFQIPPLSGIQSSPSAPLQSSSSPNPPESVENLPSVIIHHRPSPLPSPVPPSPPDTPPGSPSPPPSPKIEHAPLSRSKFCHIPSDSLPPTEFPTPTRIRPPPPAVGCCLIL